MPYNSYQKVAKNNGERVAKGLCQHCNKPRERKDILLCNVCAKKNAIAQDNFRKKAKINGMCICGYYPPMPGMTTCEECWFRMMARSSLGNRRLWKEIRQKLIEQHYTCPYSGRTLIIGDNASLDHILPKSRGGTETLDNLQWVDWNVNRAKYTMTPEEFLVFVSEVYHYRLHK